MANVYYKTKVYDSSTRQYIEKYKQLTYYDIEAAAEHHTHLISDLGMLNFKNNGCAGQNILNNFDTNHKNLLFYVPHYNSNLIYAKRMPASIIQYDTVPWCNLNKNINININNNINNPTNIETDHTTCYEYQYTYPIITQSNISDMSQYYCYYYPLQIDLISNNSNANPFINISFDSNIATNCAIKIEIDNIYKINSLIIPSNSDIRTLGLICKENKQILGFCIILTKQIKYQIEISNLKIETNCEINISQIYDDYYDVSTIPSIESSGSLGAINITNYNNISDSLARNDTSMKKYYRSYKFHNLLTWGQQVELKPCVIPGFGSTDSNLIKCGIFMLYWPYTIDPAIPNPTTQITLIGNGDIWTWNGNGDTTTNKPLNKGTSVENNKINYQIAFVKSGVIDIHMYFPIPTDYSPNCPLKFISDSGIIIKINDKPTE